jgi:penicillin-binding protein 1A
MSYTEFLSEVSDRLFEASVYKSARRYASILNTPDHFIEMLLLIEDKRFSLHCGVDPIAILRALVFNLRGGTLQGASTISQQIYNTRTRQTSVGAPARTFGRKIKQSGWSLRQSAITPKILLLREYIDTVYWGKSLYGIDDAALAYFQTRRDLLSVAQSFFLAERIAMPNRFSILRVSNLINRRAIRNALRRRCTSAKDIALLYRPFCSCGGDMWQSLER